MDVDLPNLDDTVSKLPSDIRQDLALQLSADLFRFAYGVLGYHDMTVPCHGPLTTFVDHNPKRFKGILMPRDHYKSSVVTIAGSLVKIVRDREQRILIANETSTNSERFLRSIRQHAESNRVFRALYSDLIPKDTRKVRWNDSELDFNRESHNPEPTIDTTGMTGAVTSRHYSHITIDDPISEEAVKSEKVMEDTINRLKSYPALLSKPNVDTMWLVGTRWALYDVYSWHRKMYGSQMAWFIRSAIEDGQPIFPELMNPETIALKRQLNGEYKFSCLYMNNPRNSDLQDLNVDDLKFFRFCEDGERVELLKLSANEIIVERSYRLDQLDIITTVDLAPAEKINDDRNAVVTVGITPTNEAVVLEAWGKRCTPLALIEKLFEIKQRFNPRIFGIEGVAYQKALKYFVKQEASRRGLYMRVEELGAVGKKEVRIRGLQPIMAMGRMYVNPVDHMLRNEMADFPLGEHDDVLDALAMQLQLWRGRLSPEHLEKIKKAENALVRRVMTGRTNAPQSPGRGRKDFDYDNEDEDDLPGVDPNPAQYSVVME